MEVIQGHIYNPGCELYHPKSMDGLYVRLQSKCSINASRQVLNVTLSYRLAI
jgi:hypothetical protein